MRWTAGTLAIATGVVALLVLRPWDSRRGKKGGHGAAPQSAPPAH